MRVLSETIIDISNLKKYFKIKNKGLLHAVDGVSMHIERGETLGLVGESGCGKSTIGKVIVGLESPTAGDVSFEGNSIFSAKGGWLHTVRQKIQIVFQDPYSSLNPRKNVQQILSDPFKVSKNYDKRTLKKKVEELAELTKIDRSTLKKYPHELDGGKRQTIGIARALALKPLFIVCDEPVSSLDVSIQAQIINLLMELQEKLGLTYLFISHDLSVVRHISQRIAVMYLGKIVEFAETEELFANPLHPYTKALLSAAPSLEIGRKVDRIILSGDVPSPINPKAGCRFSPRCWKSMPICEKQEPDLFEKSSGHSVACHLVG